MIYAMDCPGIRTFCDHHGNMKPLFSIAFWVLLFTGGYAQAYLPDKTKNIDALIRMAICLPISGLSVQRALP